MSPVQRDEEPQGPRDEVEGAGRVEPTEDPRQSTVILWLIAGALPVLAFLVAAFFWGRHLVPVSEQVRSDFNLLSLIFVPYVAVALAALGLGCWAARRLRMLWVARAIILLLLLPGALVLPWLLLPQSPGLGQVLPMMTSSWVLLFFELPPVATAVFAAFTRRPTLPRILGVAAASLAAGVFLFVLGGALVGAETD